LDAAQPAGTEALARERLAHALGHDEFVLFGQPIRALGVQAYPLAELLVRMRDEEKAFLPPGEFLPVLEELGMMPQLDRWVVRHAVQRLEQGSRIPCFAVNLSGQTLADPDFPAFVRDELQAADVPAAALLFEIDEADLGAGLGAALRFAAGIQHVGCRVAIDSFCCNAQSLGYLKRLRADFLKVDGSIVRKLLGSPAVARQLELTLRIAEAVGVGVIATCVEEQDVLARLKALAVGYAQGFGVYQPGPLESITGAGAAHQ
jgi:EAL domain-containing protein (putative c-di-GMP-specific phosphodiesterase class I)